MLGPIYIALEFVLENDFKMMPLLCNEVGLDVPHA